MTGFYLLLGSLLPMQSPGNLSDEDLLSKASQHYEEGLKQRDDSARAKRSFAEAATHFEQLRSRGIDSPALTRNLAQARLLEGNLALSIVTWHQGLRRWPDDPSLQQGLRETREMIQYPTNSSLPELARPHEPLPVIRWLTGSRLYLLGSCLYVGGWFMIPRAWIRRSIRSWFIVAILWLAAFSFLMIIWIEQQNQITRLQTPLVVTAQEGLILRKGNSVEFLPRLEEPLPAGIEATIRAERGGWLQVELASGVVGWLPEQSVIRVNAAQ